MPRRLVAVLLAGCLLVAACGDDDDRTSASESSGAPSATDASDGRSDAAGSDSSDGADSSSGGTATTSPTPGGGVPGGPPPPGSDAEPADIDGHVAVGAFAPAILQPGLSQRVVVEVRSQSGAEASETTISHITGILHAVTAKKVSAASGPAVAGGGDHPWSSAEIQQVADEPGTLGQGGGTAVIRLLFLHGSFGGDTGVLGVAVRGDVAAIFIDQVRASAVPLVGSGEIETAVTTHEVGHLLGLVDLYLKTGRQDPDHPGHSTNPNSVMYWQVESSLIGQLIGGPPTSFDDADRADLAAIQAGG